MLVNTLMTILFSAGVAALVVSFKRWYKRLDPGKRRLYRMLFLTYLIMLMMIGM